MPCVIPGEQIVGAASPSNAVYARRSRQRERHVQIHKAKRENVPFLEPLSPV